MELGFVTKTLGKLFSSETFIHAFQVFLFEKLTATTFLLTVIVIVFLRKFVKETNDNLEEKRHKREMERMRIIRGDE